MSGAYVEGRPPSEAQVAAIVLRVSRATMVTAQHLVLAEIQRRMPARSGMARRSTFAAPPFVSSGSIPPSAALGAIAAQKPAPNTLSSQSAPSIPATGPQTAQAGELHIIGLIGNPLKYVQALERGTGLYGPQNKLIRPTKATVLKWPERAAGHFTLTDRVRANAPKSGAAFVYRPSVKGIMPRRMFRDSAFVMGPFVKLAFQSGAKRIASDIQKLMGQT